jgi:hypothetical protein
MRGSEPGAIDPRYALKHPHLCVECQQRKPCHTVRIQTSISAWSLELCELCAHVVGERVNLNSARTGFQAKVSGVELRRMPASA